MVSLDRGGGYPTNSVRTTLMVATTRPKIVIYFYKFSLAQNQTARFFTDSEMDEPILTADGENHFNALRTVPAFR